MKILFNATNLKIGGGLQKAAEFVQAAAKWGGDQEWRMLLSKEVSSNLSDLAGGDNLRFHVYDHSPARPVLGRATRKSILDVERRFDPDAVFTLLGPAYIPFRSRHLMGYAVPWVTVPPEMLPWSSYPGWRKYRMKLWMAYQRKHARRADRWVSETSVDADGFSKALGIDRGQIDVIPNSCASHYLTEQASSAVPVEPLRALPESAVVMLTLAAAHPHKNHGVIPRVAAELNHLDPEVDWRFALTLKPEDFEPLQAEANELGVGRNLLNLGPVPASEGPGLYNRAQVMFLPTRLEVFSASYPEAMAMGVPIVTSDLPFAQDVCREAALYADPLDPVSLAKQIHAAVTESETRAALIEAGKKRLSDFGTAQERFEQYLSLLEKVAAK